ncbi:MAG: hypothetical protein WA821_19220, partial [Anaerolineales bacterium]
MSSQTYADHKAQQGNNHPNLNHHSGNKTYDHDPGNGHSHAPLDPAAPTKSRAQANTCPDQNGKKDENNHLPGASLESEKNIGSQHKGNEKQYHKVHTIRIERFRVQVFKIPKSGE